LLRESNGVKKSSWNYYGSANFLTLMGEGGILNTQIMHPVHSLKEMRLLLIF